MKHVIRRRMNRPHAEDYLPYSTTHQHPATWRVPFLAMCMVNLVMVILLGILVGNQAQFDAYTSVNREQLCEIYQQLQKSTQRDFVHSYEKLNCVEFE
jgi:hypothetical protein